jgi:hypothetical protein
MAGLFTHPCVRPAPASQRRDSDSPHGLASVATASLRFPASLADRPERPVRAFATMSLTLWQTLPQHGQFHGSPRGKQGFHANSVTDRAPSLTAFQSSAHAPYPKTR